MTTPTLHKISQSFLDAAPDAMLVVNANGRILSANHQAEQLFGYSRHDLLKRQVEALMPERFRSDHPARRQDYQRKPATRVMGEQGELYGIRKDGMEFPIEISLSPLNGGHNTTTLVALRDISIRAERGEQRFRAIFEQAHQLIGILDLEGILVEANAQSLAVSGLQRAEVIGKPFWETPWWAHSDQLQLQLRQAITRALNGDTDRFEAMHPRLDGSFATVDFSIRPARDKTGRIIFLVPESSDISLQKKAEAENADSRARAEDFRAAYEIAEQATRTKSQFLAAASHDLRQPLQSANLYLSLLQRKLQTTNAEDRHALLDVVDKLSTSLHAMGTLLDSLLDISRLERGAMKSEVVNFNLNDLLQRIIIDNIQQAKEKGLTIKADNPDFIVSSDPGLLERIIENYISNAIRYTETGTIEINCTPLKDIVRIEVTDTGSGISEEKLPHIFEEYFQLDNPNRDRRRGIGLGLSIVKHIAQLLDHPLYVSSTPGRGSVFGIDVPHGTPRNYTLSKAEIPQIHSKQPFTVLLVDDDPSILDATRMLLELANMLVHTATDLASAIEHIKAGLQPDVVVTDYRLPGDSGVDVIKQVEQLLNKSVPAILITGDTSVRTTASQLLPDCTVMFKPVDADSLIANIQGLKNRP